MQYKGDPACILSHIFVWFKPPGFNMFKYYNKKKLRKKTAHEIYGSIVTQARKPLFYAQWHIPDTVEGRFELLVMHMSLVLHRLKDGGQETKELGRLVAETFIDDLDNSFREMGVGDLKVPKKMKTASEAYFGRLQSYSAALDGDGDSDMIDTLVRNIDDSESPGPINMSALADYMLRSARVLSELELEEISGRRLVFAEV